MRDSTRYSDSEYVCLDISDAVSVAIDHIDTHVSDLSWDIDKIISMHPVYRMSEDDHSMINRMVDDMVRRGYVKNADDAEIIANHMLGELFPLVDEMARNCGYSASGICRVVMRRSVSNRVVCHALISVI